MYIALVTKVSKRCTCTQIKITSNKKSILLMELTLLKLPRKQNLLHVT